MSALPDPHEVAGEYVLGTLPAAQRREVERALPHDDRLRDAVAYWEALLLPLTSLPEPVTPSAALWARIENSVLAARGKPQSKPATTPWWNRLGLWRSLAAGGLAAAAIMAVVVAPRLQTEPEPRYVVVLAAPQNVTPGWLLKMPDARTLDLEPLVATAVPDRRVLQLWTKADGWKGPVSLGLVVPGQKTRIRLDKLAPVAPNQLFEITLEPAGGSPLPRPTGPVLYIGRAVKLT